MCSLRLQFENRRPSRMTMTRIYHAGFIIARMQAGFRRDPIAAGRTASISLLLFIQLPIGTGMKVIRIICMIQDRCNFVPGHNRALYFEISNDRASGYIDMFV